MKNKIKRKDGNSCQTTGTVRGLYTASLIVLLYYNVVYSRGGGDALKVEQTVYINDRRGGMGSNTPCVLYARE